MKKPPGTLAWVFTLQVYLRRFCFTSSSLKFGMTHDVGSHDHRLYALDAQTGDEYWSYATGGRIDSSPAVAEGVIYVGSHDHMVYALSAQTGEKLWSYTTGGRINSSPTVADRIVYVGSNDHNLYAFNQTVISAEAER